MGISVLENIKHRSSLLNGCTQIEHLKHHTLKDVAYVLSNSKINKRIKISISAHALENTEQ